MDQYPYDSQIFLGEVALYAENLDKMSQFYQEALGLQVLALEENQVLLGLENRFLVRLLQAQKRGQKGYGLYHLALLLPSRQALADSLRHLADKGIALVGGSDHGYSEALYLEDPEGNGIEFYRDKELEVWDIREDGRIVGVTEELDAQDLYDRGHPQEPFQLPSGTRMGHVHLSVKNSQKSSKFYRDLLGLADKFSVSTASWLSSGSYHHHLAVNEWDSPHLVEPEAGQAGLAYFMVYVADKEQLLTIYAKAMDLGVSAIWETSRSLGLKDPDGIGLKVLVE